MYVYMYIYIHTDLYIHIYTYSCYIWAAINCRRDLLVAIFPAQMILKICLSKEGKNKVHLFKCYNAATRA